MNELDRLDLAKWVVENIQYGELAKKAKELIAKALDGDKA